MSPRIIIIIIIIIGAGLGGPALAQGLGRSNVKNLSI